jgi:hypothetical protein
MRLAGDVTVVPKAFYNQGICGCGAPAVISTDKGGEFRSDSDHMTSRLGAILCGPVRMSILFL